MSQAASANAAELGRGFGFHGGQPAIKRSSCSAAGKLEEKSNTSMHTWRRGAAYRPWQILEQIHGCFYCIINLGLWLDSTRNVFALVFFASLYSSFGGMHTSDYLFKRLKLSLLQAWHGKHPTHMMMTTFSTSPTPRRA